MGGGPEQDVLLCTLPFPEPKDILAKLRKDFPDAKVVYIDVSSASADRVPAHVWEAATILFTVFTFPQRVADAPNLRLVHLASAGSDGMAHEPLYTDSDVTITTSSGIHGPQIAEWAVMTRLVASHGYNALRELQKQHRWGRRKVKGSSNDNDDDDNDDDDGNDNDDAPYHRVRDSVGLRVGILGYGSIGRQIGRVAVAQGMRVVAYTASRKDSAAARRDAGFIVPGTGDPAGELPDAWFSGLDRGSLRAFLAQDLDWLVVAVPLTAQTRRFLGAEEFRVLGRGGERPAFVTNIARGQIIDQPALIDALKAGVVAGAALDVTDPEPLPPDSELWDMRNVIITPHVAGVGDAYLERTFAVLEENLRRSARGEKLLNVVRRERGY